MGLACALLFSLLLTVSLASFDYDWARLSLAAPEQALTFHVALHQRNLDKAEELLYAISSPRSPQYGKIISEEEINDLIYPPAEEHDRVLAFFEEFSSKVDVTSYGDALKVTAPVEIISSIFSATFHTYRHGPTGRKTIRARDGIVIPSQISQDIYMITGLVSFPIIPAKLRLTPVTNAPTDSEFGYLAPETIRRLYNIPSHQKVTNAASSQCAIEFEGSAYNATDYLLMTKLSDEPFYNFTHLEGDLFPGDDIEANLDTQLIGTIGSGAQNWYWTFNDAWIYEMALAVYNNKTRPNVLSISYAWPEVIQCDGTVGNCDGLTPSKYIERANAEVMKLGLVRVTVVSASGDWGAPSIINGGCGNTTHPVFSYYPASSPYILSVSGSALMPDNTPPNPHYGYPPICQQNNTNTCSNSTLEYPCMPNNTYYDWTTGGGFSDTIPAPSYQAAAVKAYLSSKAMLPPKGGFSPQNRGYPDITAIGARTLIINEGQLFIGEGTSASTPIIAGIVTLLNDARLNANKNPLGFLNPALYELFATNPKAFNDITQGSNQCSEDGCCPNGFGYGATVGWDAVTGLGSPNFAELLAYVLTLP